MIITKTQKISTVFNIILFISCFLASLLSLNFNSSSHGLLHITLTKQFKQGSFIFIFSFHVLASSMSKLLLLLVLLFEVFLLHVLGLLFWLALLGYLSLCNHSISRNCKEYHSKHVFCFDMLLWLYIQYRVSYLIPR